MIPEGVVSPFFCIRKGTFMTKTQETLRKTLIGALLLALAYVLPFLTGQIPEIGSRLCPMHIPVLLCGFILGPAWGGALGFIAPLLRSLTLGMPILFPGAVCMAFELAAYGLVSGLVYQLLPKMKLRIYCALISAMVLGRVVWGAAMYVCMGIKGGSFTLSAFLAGAVTNAIPGMIVQLVLIPVLVGVYHRYLNKR